MNGEQPTEEQAQRQTLKVEPAAEDLLKEEPTPAPRRREPTDRSQASVRR